MHLINTKRKFDGLKRGASRYRSLLIDRYPKLGVQILGGDDIRGALVDLWNDGKHDTFNTF